MAAAVACCGVPLALPGAAQTTAAGNPSQQPAAPAKPAPPGWAPQVSKPSGPAAITHARLQADQTRTQFIATISRRLPAQAYVVGDPYRVVIDLPGVEFRLPADTGRQGQGLISAFRYGLLEHGKSRIVLDATGPVKVERASVVGGRPGAPSSLVVDIVAVDPSQVPPVAEAVKAGPPPALKPGQFEATAVDPKPRRSKPVIVIDPGHGGIDPGTIGATELQEKGITLAVARQLRQVLAQSARYDVHMTRHTDVFVSLDQRLDLSRRLAADLFVSIHADAVPQQNLAQSIRGATIYTLSEHASDEEARRFAEKENASDTLAGLHAADRDGQGQVRDILVDLMKRETANFSSEFRVMLVSQLRSHLALARDPQRSASFKVLRQMQTPSVLVELGYMSHAEDQKLLKSPDWQKEVATRMAAAIDVYFAKRSADAGR